MATIYVRSTDGLDTDTGATWALAKATITGAAAIDAAGDTIFLSDNHAETTAGAVTVALAGTVGSPLRILSGDDAAEPPTALTTTASITTTGTAAILINGSAYIYGVTFSAGTAAGAGNLSFCGVAGNRQRLKNCTLIIGNTSASSLITVGTGATARECLGEFINCTFQFGATTQRLGTTGWVVIRGGAASASGSTPAHFLNPFFSAGEPCNIQVDGFDFSAWAATFNLIQGGAVTQCGSARFHGCKLPAAWTGLLWSATPTTPGFRAEMINCDSGDTNYRMWIEDYCGAIRDETTIVRTGGASDGTTAISWKMTGSANASYPLNVLRSQEIAIWNETTGSAKTITVEIVHDSLTALDDDEIFLDVQYLGTSGFPLALQIDDSIANVLATPAAQTTSTEAWTTTGITNVNKQKLSVTFTPQEKGFFVATVCLALASKVVYVCPKLTVT